MLTIHLDSLNINYSSDADKQAHNSKSRTSSELKWVNCVNPLNGQFQDSLPCVSDVYQCSRNAINRKELKTIGRKHFEVVEMCLVDY